MPLDLNNFAPRVGFSYAIGDQTPTVIRAGYGLFYPRIPQIYNSVVETDNGLMPNSVFLNQTNFYAQQVFPQYPLPLIICAPLAITCTAPSNLQPFVSSDLSAFAHNFRTPEVHQASLTVEREIANPLLPMSRIPTCMDKTSSAPATSIFRCHHGAISGPCFIRCQCRGLRNNPVLLDLATYADPGLPIPAVYFDSAYSATGRNRCI